MNSRTQKELVNMLKHLRVMAFRSSHESTAELVDACSSAIDALNNDETIVETGTENEENN